MANSTDQRDPGGRLGPYVGMLVSPLFFSTSERSCCFKYKLTIFVFLYFTDQGHPDLRNLALFHLPIEEGDTLVVVSDGVHDNFDPSLIGLMPNMISDSPCGKWEDMNPMEGEVCFYIHIKHTHSLSITGMCIWTYAHVLNITRSHLLHYIITWIKHMHSTPAPLSVRVY